MSDTKNVVPFAPNSFRAAPQNVDAERALLGAIMMNNRSFEKVADFLLPIHFSEPANARLFEVCQQLIAKGHQANPVTLRTYLENDQIVIAAGGMNYIAALAGSVVSMVNVSDYGKMIEDLYQRRELIGVGDALVNDAFDIRPEERGTDIIERYEHELFMLASNGRVETGPIPFIQAAHKAIEMADRAMRHKGAVVGTTTGLRDLDQKLGGLHSSDLIVLAARPGMGKTALATCIATAAAREDGAKGVLFFSLEMSSDQLANRVLADVASLDAHRIRSGKISNEDFAQMAAAIGDLQGMPLHVDDTPALTVTAMRTRARRLIRQTGGLALIVIDYIQLIETVRGRREENRVQEVSAITRGLKALAKELNVPVLALSQLSRKVEDRDEPRPRLSDLRESGSIEQDADVVMFIYREEYYLKDECPEDLKNLAIIDVAKQRHGPTGDVAVVFDGPHTAFRDLARDHG